MIHSFISPRTIHSEGKNLGKLLLFIWLTLDLSQVFLKS